MTLNTIALTTSTSFALSSDAIIEALRVSKVSNIFSITEDKEGLRPRCPCDLVMIKGETQDGNQISESIIVEHLGDNTVRALRKK